jgi:hypothetical protein
MTNIPYKLPDGWQWVKLGEVCNERDSVILDRAIILNFSRYLGMEHYSWSMDEPTPVTFGSGSQNYPPPTP